MFIIAHKVRGELAFDVAIQMHVPALNETWWIIPTSGHRAYPLNTWEIANPFTDDLDLASVPEHYAHADAPAQPPLDLKEFLNSLEPTIRRRPLNAR